MMGGAPLNEASQTECDDKTRMILLTFIQFPLSAGQGEEGGGAKVIIIPPMIVLLPPFFISTRSIQDDGGMKERYDA